MAAERPVNIPVILGTTRKGRMSANVANFIVGEIGNRENCVTDLIDIGDLEIPVDDAGRGAQDPRYAQKIDRADGIVVVAPEYNHSFPGLLKHVMDTASKEYIHKAVGIVGVSAGPFGGTRVIQNLLPVMRELGLVTIFWDLHFSNVGEAFDEQGHLVNEAYKTRADKFLGELVWMSKTLRHGRTHVALDNK